MARQFRGIAGGGRFPAAYWTNPYQEHPFPGFGKGLVLRDQPDAIPPDAALDCLNVDLTQRGAVKQRNGYGKLTLSALTNRGDSLSPFYKTDGTRQLLVGAGTRLEALNTGGGVVSSATGLTGGPWGFMRYGQPNTEVAYAGNGTDTLQKWDGGSWTAPTATVDSVAAKAMPKAGTGAVWASENRLVVSGFSTTTGGPNGAVSSPSHVYFSEAGNPEAWMVTSNLSASPPTYANNVQLSPGDGEAIQAVVAWQDFLFVFKESKFFVFNNEGVDSTGGPIFRYRTVDTGIGLASRRAVCVGHDGVYFLGRAGVYRTTGDAPMLISGVLDPLFIGGLSSFYSGSELSHANIAKASMCWHEERIYLALPTAATTNDRLLIFDPRNAWWGIYDLPCAAVASFRISDQAELVFAFSTGTNDVGRHSPAFPTDNGQSINSFWYSGWYDMGSPDIKTLREFKVWGSGKVNVATAVDFEGTPVLSELDFTTEGDKWADGTNPQDLWGFHGTPTRTWSDSGTWSGAGAWSDSTGSTGPDLWGGGVVLSPQLVRQATRGTVLSLRLQSRAGAAWTVERLTQHIREQEVATKVHA